MMLLKLKTIQSNYRIALKSFSTITAMILAFYKVNNSLAYGRHEFDKFYDQPELIVEKLNKLPEDEVKFYDTDHFGYGAVPSPNLADFVEDYNDEELDGGWWVIAINNPKK